MHKKKKVNKNYIDLMDSDNDDGGADIGKRKKKYRHNEIPSCIELIDSDGEADHEHKDLNKKKKGKGHTSSSPKSGDGLDRRASRVTTAESRNDSSITTRHVE